MKRLFAILLVGALLLGSVGCQRQAPKLEDPDILPVDGIPAGGVEVEWCAQYIRTNGHQDGAKFPEVVIIKSAKELNDYYNANKDIFDLERKDKVYSDTTIGFLDACDQYDEAFFEKNHLIFVLLEEGSGSVRHEVRGVEQTVDQKIGISIDRKIPEVGTDDMAQWHIVLELSRDVIIGNPNNVLVYLDGDLAWNGSVVEPPKPEAAFKKPPKGTMVTPEGDAPLCTGGYSWFYALGNGLEEATIADQASRPLPQDSLRPVTIDSKYAETVYAPVPGGDTHAPTNSLGYLLKLNWEADPSSVTYTCWQETVWKNGNTPEQTVVSQDLSFYAKPGGYIYEIAATWDDTGVGYHGTANYYVYIVGADGYDDETHEHRTALRPQTVAEPITGYCGNTQTTLRIGNKDYIFAFGNSVKLTDLLVNLDYDPNKVCRCTAQYRADTEFGADYQIHLEYAFVRCDKGQADLTQEQVDTISQIIAWAETTNCQYPIGN